MSKLRGGSEDEQAISMVRTNETPAEEGGQILTPPQGRGLVERGGGALAHQAPSVRGPMSSSTKGVLSGHPWLTIALQIGFVGMR